MNRFVKRVVTLIFLVFVANNAQAFTIVSCEWDSWPFGNAPNPTHTSLNLILPAEDLIGNDLEGNGTFSNSNFSTIVGPLTAVFDNALQPFISVPIAWRDVPTFGFYDALWQNRAGFSIVINLGEFGGCFTTLKESDET